MDNSGLYHLNAYWHNMLTTKRKEMELKYENEGFYTGHKDTFVRDDGMWNTHAPQAAQANQVNDFHEALQDKFIGAGSPEYEFLIPCLHPFCRQNRALPPGVQLKIELHRNMPSIMFNARNQASVPIIQLTDIKLEFETFELEDKIGEDLMVDLVSKPFNIDIDRRQIHKIHLPSGTVTTLQQLISAELPNRLMIGFVDVGAQGATGNREKSWQNFKRMEVTKARLKYGIQNLPDVMGYQIEGGNDDEVVKRTSRFAILRMLDSLYQASNGKEYGEFIYDIDMWLKHPLYIFDLTQDHGARNSEDYDKTMFVGDASLDLEFLNDPQAAAGIVMGIVKMSDFADTAMVSLPAGTVTPNFIS